jgi:predicted RNA polymerase sigma factor
VAIAQAFGPQAGLDIVLPLFDVAELRQYHLLPAVAGDLLCRIGSMVVPGNTSSMRHR